MGQLLDVLDTVSSQTLITGPEFDSVRSDSSRFDPILFDPVRIDLILQRALLPTTLLAHVHVGANLVPSDVVFDSTYLIRPDSILPELPMVKSTTKSTTKASCLYSY